MKLAVIGAALALLASVPASAATVVINPATGASGSFSWSNGLGPIDQIDGTFSVDSVDFGVTANAGDLIDVQLNDCCVPGDQFALFLNGLQITPTSVAGSPFSYFFDDVVLGSGSNIFSVSLTALAPGFTTGGANYSFSAVTPGAVPEPGTWAMMLIGFGAVGFAMRRQRQVALATA